MDGTKLLQELHTYIQEKLKVSGQLFGMMSLSVGLLTVTGWGWRYGWVAFCGLPSRHYVIQYTL